MSLWSGLFFPRPISCLGSADLSNNFYLLRIASCARSTEYVILLFQMPQRTTGRGGTSTYFRVCTTTKSRLDYLFTPTLCLCLRGEYHKKRNKIACHAISFLVLWLFFRLHRLGSRPMLIANGAPIEYLVAGKFASDIHKTHACMNNKTYSMVGYLLPTRHATPMDKLKVYLLYGCIKPRIRLLCTP